MLGNKEEILQKILADYKNKELTKDEMDVKRLMKSSEIKLTIYPAFEDFFERER